MINSIANSGIGMTSERTRKRLVAEIKALGITDERVLSAILKTPRHLFVDEALSSRAYENTALPIGFGQTISQPYTVALMTSLLFSGEKRKHVLEIGTGCGYQTAILSFFADSVISVECIQMLQRLARDRLYDMKIRNIKCVHGDGFTGLVEFAPYDGILAAAVSADVPEELLNQLAEGGRLVMPLATEASKLATQQLLVVDKTSTGYKKQLNELVSFVPRRFGVVK